MYTYRNFYEDTDYLVYKKMQVKRIGDSYLGNPILAFESGVPDVIITGGIHARENISVFAAMMCAFQALRLGLDNVAVVPLINPDGLLLTERGTFFKGAEELKELCNGDFSLWKANARGVDLNLNFDARFGEGLGNIFTPAPSGYVGEKPFSEHETRAIAAYTKQINPTLTLSLHAQGREIYWFFGQSGERQKRDKAIADKLGKITGYTVVDSDLNSAGGYKDWCIEKLGIPSFTLELGLGDHPLPEECYSREWRKISGIVKLVSEIAAELRNQNT